VPSKRQTLIVLIASVAATIRMVLIASVKGTALAVLRSNTTTRSRAFAFGTVCTSRHASGKHGPDCLCIPRLGSANSGEQTCTPASCSAQQTCTVRGWRVHAILWAEEVQLVGVQLERGRPESTASGLSSGSLSDSALRRRPARPTKAKAQA
jgi:hypothetical protein